MRWELRQGMVWMVSEAARGVSVKGVSSEGPKMNHSWAKNRATSRRAGSRRDVTESFTRQRRDVRDDVAT